MRYQFTASQMKSERISFRDFEPGDVIQVGVMEIRIEDPIKLYRKGRRVNETQATQAWVKDFLYPDEPNEYQRILQNKIKVNPEYIVGGGKAKRTGGSSWRYENQLAAMQASEIEGIQNNPRVRTCTRCKRWYLSRIQFDQVGARMCRACKVVHKAEIKEKAQERAVENPQKRQENQKPPVD